MGAVAVYLAMEVRLFRVPEGEDVGDVTEKIREAVEKVYQSEFDDDIEIEVIEHAGLDCGECGTKSGRHREV